MIDWDGLKFVGSILLISVLIVSLIFSGLMLTTYPACQSYQHMGIQVQWSFWTGCMAHHSQFGWLPVDEYFKTLNVSVGK